MCVFFYLNDHFFFILEVLRAPRSNTFIIAHNQIWPPVLQRGCKTPAVTLKLLHELKASSCVGLIGLADLQSIKIRELAGKCLGVNV